MCHASLTELRIARFPLRKVLLYRQGFEPSEGREFLLPD